MIDLMLDNAKTLVGALVAILIAGVGAALKDGKFIRKVFESWLTPNQFGTYKRENPKSHPIFLTLHDLMTSKQPIPQFDKKKQEIYKLYTKAFYQTFYKESKAFVGSNYFERSKEEFELELTIWFNEMTSKAYSAINKKLEFPEHVRERMIRFQRKQQQSFKAVLSVWFNDIRFEGIKNGNQTQLYNILNDLQSQLVAFDLDVVEYFTDLNGKLGENTKVIA